VGHVGFVGNLNYFEILDLALGFAGIDLCGDDGALLGHWPGQTAQEADEAAYEFEETRRTFQDQPTTSRSRW